MIKETFNHFSSTFYSVIKRTKQRNFDHTLYRQVLRKVFLDMHKNIAAIADHR